MKRICLLAIGFQLLATGSFCQVKKADSNREASFPGGVDALNKYVESSINYPKTAEDKKIEGIVYVAFAVEKDGNVDSVRVVQGVKDCPEIDKEAKRVVMSMPKWLPAISQGKPYRSQFEVPIQFLLSKDTKPAR